MYELNAQTLSTHMVTMILNIMFF